MAVCFFTSSGGDGADTSVVTAGAEDVLSGKVIVDANGNPLTGTMTNRGAISQSLGINGSYTIPQGYHNGSGKVSQSISTMGAQTITPKSSAQTVSCNGKYMTGNITVNAANIYKVVTGTATATVWPGSSVTVATSSGEHNSGYWTASLTGFKSISRVLIKPSLKYDNSTTCEPPVLITSATSALAGSKTYTMSGCTFSATYLKLPAVFYAVGSSYYGTSAKVSVTYYVYGIAS